MSQTEVQLIKADSVVTADIANSAVTDAKITALTSSKLTGALPAISGANLTGISSSTAYSYIDQWALNTTLSLSSTAYWAGSQLSRSDSYAVTIGSAMTVDSNGVFTFPATGIYRIYARQQYLANSTASRYIGTFIQASTNSGSSFTQIADSVDSMSSISGATYVNGQCEGFFDVTDTSTHKIRFGGYAHSTVSIQGSEHANGVPTTFFRFMKVADT